MSRHMLSSPKASIEFGMWLREIRTSRNLPIRVVAAAVEMDQAHLCKVELGHRMLTQKQVHALANFFELDKDEFEARQIAAKFTSEYSDCLATRKAVEMLFEARSTYDANVTPTSGE
ncbi:MAG: helix-turn-helix domain-containing protein [Fimbriimonadaceae bacterium]